MQRDSDKCAASQNAPVRETSRVSWPQWLPLLVLLLASLGVGLVACDAVAPSAVSELVIEEIAPGEGDSAQAGKTVYVHYTGWLYDAGAEGGRGAKFDSSRDRGQPFSFLLGGGRVIKGWDEGVVGMKIGGKRVLTIPPELGYGASGAGRVIPANATLIFEIERMAPTDR